jgi:hypothetical protein
MILIRCLVSVIPVSEHLLFILNVSGKARKYFSIPVPGIEMQVARWLQVPVQRS